MLEKLGRSVPRLPFDSVKTRVLEEFEGERIVEHTTSSRHVYLRIWFDRDDSTTRWLIVPVYTDVVESYLQNGITLRDMILNPRDGSVYILDEKDDGSGSNVSSLMPRWLDEDSLPTHDSYHIGCRHE